MSSPPTLGKEHILAVIIRHLREVVPDLEAHAVRPGGSLKALGANSIDRADIIMMTLDTLALDIPLTEMARADSIDDLAGIIHARC